eukprot:102834_1
MSYTSVMLDHVDIDTEYLFDGYFRQATKLITRNKLSIFNSIPDNIMYTCIAFYYVFEEFILTTNYGIEIEKDGIFLESSADNEPLDTFTIFGKYIIPSIKPLIYKWDFKVISLKHFMFIGITSDYNTPKGRFFGNDKSCSYAIDLKTPMARNRGKQHSYRVRYKTDDTMTMELNLHKQRLIFWKNGQCKGAAFDVICGHSIFYKMAIVFTDKGSKLMLTGFSILLP